MDLVQFIIGQGVDPALAAELAQRKASSKKLVGVMVGKKWISLSPADGKKFDEMVESGNVPGCNTDATFLQGSGSQFVNTPEIGDFYKKQCEAEGVSTNGKKYLSQLARHPGDSRAWVSGRGDVQKRLEELGWGCEGSVTVKGKQQDKPPPEPIPIAEHILDRETARELMDQTVTVKEYKETRERVADKITPPDKKKKKS